MRHWLRRHLTWNGRALQQRLDTIAAMGPVWEYAARIRIIRQRLAA